VGEIVSVALLEVEERWRNSRLVSASDESVNSVRNSNEKAK
jgi:hypothetical protein